MHKIAFNTGSQDLKDKMWRERALTAVSTV